LLFHWGSAFTHDLLDQLTATLRRVAARRTVFDHDVLTHVVDRT
jgi:hypothetical protein